MILILTEVYEKGYSFCLKYNGESIDISEWNRNIESNEDVVAYQLLNQLVDDGSGQINDKHFLISHEAVSTLPQEERDILNLPDPFPFDIEISALGNLTDPAFKYQYKYLNGGTQSFVNPRRIGSLLQISNEESYSLIGNQYLVIESLDKFNNASSDTKDSKSNYLSFGEIKNLMGDIGFALDNYLNSEEVVSPQNICLRLNPLEDGSVEILPIFCNEGESEDGVKFNANILNKEQTQSFHKNFRRLKEKDIYSIPNGPKVILNEKQKESLGAVKLHSRVDKDDRIILSKPQSFFDPEAIDFDKPIFEDGELTTWSERVIAIGEYKYKAIPFVRQNKNSWLPPEGGILLNDDFLNIPQEDRCKVKNDIEEAIKQKIPFVEYGGKKIPARPEVLDAINDLIREYPKGSSVKAKGVNGDSKENSTSKVLIIKGNIEKDEFGTIVQPRNGDTQIPIPLKEGKRFLGHQQDGVNWLQNRWIDGYRGCLLADDMGLGKTLQALSFISWIKKINTNNQNKILIIAPVVLLENWKNEYARFMEPVFGPFYELHDKGLRDIKMKEISQSLNIRKEIDIKNKEDAEKILKMGRGLLLDLHELAKHQVILTTYETARDYQFSLGLINWDVLVLDECQKIKTPNAMVTSAIKAMKYDFGLVLTGTPIENSWVDLWSIIDFVQPGYLGSLKEFSAKYQHPLRKEETDRECLGNELKAKVDPIILRRMKEDNLEGLPKKIIVKHDKEQMPEVQLNRYLEVIRKARSAPSGSGSEKIHIFNTIRTLSDISLHPDLPYLSDLGFAEKNDNEIINSSARFITTFSLISEIRKKAEKVIVFLISRKMQRVVKRLLDNKFRLETHIINGQVKGAERQNLIDAFQNTHGFNVIILSPEAAGVGLNITEANHVIHLSRTWNPAKEDQASDRIYRIGQKKDVFIHLPMSIHTTFNNEDCRGTFDQKLDRLLDEKRDLHKRVLFPANVNESDLRGIGEEILGFDTSVGQDSNIQITDVDSLSSDIFEKFIALLFRSPSQNKVYQTQVTGGPGDQGADVIGFPHGNEGNGIIVQCKHSMNINKHQGNTGVQEVIGAKGVYEAKYSREFDLIVATNSAGFTRNAEEIARGNKVQLISRTNIISMLKTQKVSFANLSGLSE
jgi:SNF2 family DNA or RNA helicase